MAYCCLNGSYFCYWVLTLVTEMAFSSICEDGAPVGDFSGVSTNSVTVFFWIPGRFWLGESRLLTWWDATLTAALRPTTELAFAAGRSGLLFRGILAWPTVKGAGRYSPPIDLVFSDLADDFPWPCESLLTRSIWHFLNGVTNGAPPLLFWVSFIWIWLGVNNLGSLYFWNFSYILGANNLPGPRLRLGKSRPWDLEKLSCYGVAAEFFLGTSFWPITILLLYKLLVSWVL